MKYPGIIHVSFEHQCKPGDPPPEGYMAWHQWAQTQYNSGLRQRTCPNCGLWKFPQEFSESTLKTEFMDGSGRKITDGKHVCIECAVLLHTRRI
jgi:hypothetical protein